ncbi:hypothetical protein MCETOYE15_01216 [Candidatus Nanopelagicaceae bacterium]
MISAEVVGFIAGALGMFFGLPQALRVRRLGHGRGVSLISWMLQFGVATSWAAYGLDIRSPSVLLTNVGAGLINASVIMAVMRNNVKSLSILIAYASLLTTLVLVLPSFLVSALLISLLYAQGPQIAKSYKNISAGKDSAVSIAALSVSSFSIFLWFIYAVMVSDSLIMVSSVISFSSMISIIILESIGKRKRVLNTA